MSNALYTKAKQHLIAGEIDLDSHAIKAIFVDGADYTPVLASHEKLSDIPVGARVATSGALQNKTVTDGVFDADDITVSAVTGDTFEYIVLYDDDAADDLLLLLIDTFTGNPCTPTGSDIKITWPSSSDKIFRLS